MAVDRNPDETVDALLDDKLTYEEADETITSMGRRGFFRRAGKTAAGAAVAAAVVARPTTMAAVGLTDHDRARDAKHLYEMGAIDRDEVVREVVVTREEVVQKVVGGLTCPNCGRPPCSMIWNGERRYYLNTCEMEHYWKMGEK